MDNIGLDLHKRESQLCILTAREWSPIGAKRSTRSWRGRKSYT
jgi:hypothetical protein